MSKKSNTVRKTRVEPVVEAEVKVEAPVVAEVQAPAVVVAEVQALEVKKIEGTSAELIAKHGNKSNAIRFLNSEGHKTAAIAKALEIRYQHVRNVLNQPLKRVIKAERDAAAIPVAAAAVTETA